MAASSCKFDLEACAECALFGDCLDESLVSAGVNLEPIPLDGPLKLFVGSAPGAKQRAHRRLEWGRVE